MLRCSSELYGGCAKCCSRAKWGGRVRQLLPSVRTILADLAAQGHVSKVAWYASLPDKLGRRDRRGYLTVGVHYDRDNREHLKNMIEQTMEFKQWHHVDLEKGGQWSFLMHDVPTQAVDA